MKENRLKQLWQDKRPALGGWLTIPNSFSAEVMAHQGFDWLCIDMQHGLIDYQCALVMLQAISTTSTVPLVRVPWNDAAIIMKVLDAGAYGVIIPMVNSRSQAEAAAASCRYPPVGGRSFGPLRAAYYAGSDYVARANEEICCIPQIETTKALDNLDDILSVPGIDAIYVGPSDLSLSLGLPPARDHGEASFTGAIERILEACRRHQVVPGIAADAKTAPKRMEQGFLMVQVVSDAVTLAQGAARDLHQVRPSETERGQA